MSAYMLTSSSLLYCNDILCSFAEVNDHTKNILKEIKPVLENLKQKKNDTGDGIASYEWIFNDGKY